MPGGKKESVAASKQTNSQSQLASRSSKEKKTGSTEKSIEKDLLCETSTNVSVMKDSSLKGNTVGTVSSGATIGGKKESVAASKQTNSQSQVASKSNKASTNVSVMKDSSLKENTVGTVTSGATIACRKEIIIEGSSVEEKTASTAGRSCINTMKDKRKKKKVGIFGIKME